MRRTIGVVLAAVCSLTPAAAQESGPGDDTLKIAMSGQYMPLHGLEGGQWTGFEADLARALAKRMGKTPLFLGAKDIKVGILPAVACGLADVGLAAITPTDERRRFVGFTKPLVVIDYVLVGHRDRKKLADARNARFAMPRGPALDLVRDHIKVIPTSSTRSAIRLLRMGKVDFVIGEEIASRQATRGLPLIVFDPPLGRSPIAMALPDNKMYEIDRQVSLMTNELEKLRTKWKLAKPGRYDHRPWIDLRVLDSLKPGNWIKRIPQVPEEQDWKDYFCLTVCDAPAFSRPGEKKPAGRIPGAEGVERVQTEGDWVQIKAWDRSLWMKASDLLCCGQKLFVVKTKSETVVKEGDGPCGTNHTYTETEHTILPTKALEAFLESYDSDSTDTTTHRITGVLFQRLLRQEGVLSGLVQEYANGLLEYDRCSQEEHARMLAEEGSIVDGCPECTSPDEYYGIKDALESLNQFFEAPDCMMDYESLGQALGLDEEAASRIRENTDVVLNPLCE
jgi:ABC-type amino acid transport substrate-binding protein